MPSIYQLKPAFQRCLRPSVRYLYKRGVTANQVTLIAMLLSILLACGIYFYNFNAIHAWSFVLIPVWMLLRMAFNAIDGMLAREFKQQSKLGAYLNELCDVVADSALYVCFIVVTQIQTELLLFVTFLAILSEYAGVMAPLVGVDRRYDGPMGKSDRAFAFSLLALLVACQAWLTEKIVQFSCNSILIIILFCLFITIFNRIKKAL
ncbi:CDP-alcohol phosphatidyltransferase family protein [Acinetobacter sp. ME22]|uniref:CDP-alcohol phosphatidyltransferase family protein n=1 Tax=Acinetobacter sp. ME22 TaxID=2904802 RepID=UPI001EDB4BBD|nr:CDP-alcohol phosphatidyltransferase family protein [Acinetobacter sp. ME22]MCG2572605.1 CDP-alcohol phosphatidyltransferase family protein [Acinetobacter sp. ME22]